MLHWYLAIVQAQTLRYVGQSIANSHSSVLQQLRILYLFYHSRRINCIELLNSVMTLELMMGVEIVYHINYECKLQLIVHQNRLK